MSFAEIAKSLSGSLEALAKRLARLERTPAPKDGERGPVGEPGLPGRDGRDGEKGADGRDGADGLGFDAFNERIEDGGRFVIHEYLRNGEVVREFRHKTATVIYRGVHVAKPYDHGDSVTFGGSQWIAMRDTTAEEKPGISDAFQLSNKKGRDGKDGVVKEAPKPGPVRAP